jgi:hypothetical protein
LAANRLSLEVGTNLRAGHSRGEFTHLLFLDSDHSFLPEEIIRLVDANLDIVGLSCSPKLVNWRNVRSAVLKGVPAEDLPLYASGCAAEFYKEPEKLKATDRLFREGKPFPVRRLGTGVMLVKTPVLQKFMDRFPERHYDVPPGERNHGYWGRATAFEFFRTGIDPKSKTYLPEDYFFCEDAHALGYDTYLLAARTLHWGTHAFVCDLPALARLANP